MRILRSNVWKYAGTRDGAFIFEDLRDVSERPAQIMIWTGKYIFIDGEDDYVFYLSSQIVNGEVIPVAVPSYATQRRIARGELKDISIFHYREDTRLAAHA